MRIKDYFHSTVGSSDKGEVGGDGGEEGEVVDPKMTCGGRGRSPPPPLSPEEDAERTTVLFKISPALVLFAAIYFAVTGGLTLSGIVDLSGKTAVESMKTFGDKAEFIARYQVAGVGWLVFWTLWVIGRRMYAGALNPVARESREAWVACQKNILTNSVEQWVMSGWAQLVMAASVSGECLARSVPWINFSFLIGRIAYAAGYPRYRLFGLLLSLCPTLGMTAVGVYKLGAHFFC